MPLPPAPPPRGGLPSGRDYSAHPTPPPVPTGKDYSVGRPGSDGTFDTGAAAAQRKQESRAAFTRGQKPKPTYTTPQGETRPIDPNDRRVEEVRRRYNPGWWATRQQRQQQTFPTPPPGPVVVYNDPFSNWFWFWLLTQDLNTRAAWAYHHQADMDQARYRDLLAKDKQLEARVRELEAKKVPRDSTYTPPGVDEDLMYDDGFVEAAVNPQPAPSAVPSAPARPTPPARTIGGALLRIVLILALLSFLVWLVFIKRWGGT
jgi:hypothetical protein